MKSKILPALILLILAFASCDTDDNEQEFELVNVVTPVYMSKDELRGRVWN